MHACKGFSLVNICIHPGKYHLDQDLQCFHPTRGFSPAPSLSTQPTIQILPLLINLAYFLNSYKWNLTAGTLLCLASFTEQYVRLLFWPVVFPLTVYSMLLSPLHDGLQGIEFQVDRYFFSAFEDGISMSIHLYCYQKDLCCQVDSFFFDSSLTFSLLFTFSSYSCV